VDEKIEEFLLGDTIWVFLAVLDQHAHGAGIRKFFGSHEPLIIPFLGFTLGQGINLNKVI
jgi:hypothetical protein